MRAKLNGLASCGVQRVTVESYTKLPGYYEQHELAKFVMRHFGKISKTLLKAMDVKTEPDHRPEDLCKDERLIDHSRARRPSTTVMPRSENIHYPH
eukprot:COSAG03_NODE_1318_length_4338_cov_5.485492_6_plen_96_part_00